MSSKLFFKAVKKGREGHNIGVSTGLEKLDSYIFGIQKKSLITIGADSGSGKTSFALASFIYNLIKNKGDKKLSILYYSFEMSKEALYAKLTSLYIYDVFGKILTYKKILSLTEVLSDEDYALIESASKWLSEMDDYLKIYDRAISPTAIYATCKEWLCTLGTFEQVDEHREEYHPNDDRYKLVIWDHMGLISGKGSKKERIDTVADYAVYFRNKCDITGIFVQQLNRNAKAMDRKTNGYELIGLEDFKDTSGTTDASEVVLALYFPYREKIARCEGYPIQNVLKKRFRLLQILKNRYGDADLSIGCGFYGEIGLFKELPKPDEISDYSKYLELTPETGDHKTQINTKPDEEIDEKNVFKF